MKTLFFLLTLLSTVCLNGQTYLISFTGTGLTNVKVENLKSGLTVNVPSGDILRLSLTTGLNDINSQEQSQLKVYPNPAKENLNIEILPPVAGEATITVTDIAGKAIISDREYFDNSKQTFVIAGMQEGLHIVNVRGNGYQYSAKFISAISSPGKPLISRISDNISRDNKASDIKESKGTAAYVDMNYNSGEILKYTAISGNNKTVSTGVPSGNATIPFTFFECKDGDNNYYPVVKINNQVWMAENLKTTKYNTGATIPNLTVNTDWRDTREAAYCWYNNNESVNKIYGALYNWHAANNAEICPTGWHVPTFDEYKMLEISLGMTKEQADKEGWTGTTEGGKLKETSTLHWSNPNEGATNESGFTALAGGVRLSDGIYYGIGIGGLWWSTTVYDTTWSWMIQLANSNSLINNYSMANSAGISIRCLKN
jgi:uncharacterized protein (TIGR02145 family)